MHKYGLGKMVNPPKGDAEWVKLDLLEKAKAELHRIAKILAAELALEHRFADVFFGEIRLLDERLGPDLAEKYVRETVFKGQLSSKDFRDSMENADYTYDMPAGHMQVTADRGRRRGDSR
jgi:hypothetical protein